MSKSLFPSPPASSSESINVGDAERIGSIAGGALLAYLGLRKFSLTRLTLAATGGAMLYRGVTGYCPANEELGRDTSASGSQTDPIEIETSLTVEQSREEVYAFWRELENLPRFMEHLSEVRDLGGGRSHWVASVPGGFGHIEWDAEIADEDEGRRLAWHSVEGADIANTGEVRFKDAPGGRGTEIHAKIAYRPPAGEIGQAAARLFNPAFGQMVKEDVRRFKHVAEAGEIPTVDNQPAGGEPASTE